MQVQRQRGGGGDHLPLPDNTILFCKANSDQPMYLGGILTWFKAILGLRINLNKSEIILVGRVNVGVLVTELGCGIGSLPFLYLGLPLGASHKSVGIWDTIEERFRKKLASWKR